MPSSRLFLLLVFLAPLPLQAKPETFLAVGPGPQTISPEEAALAPEGKPDAVVLLEERSIDEHLTTDREIRFHLRAKILTNEGREVADVTIPYLKGEDKIKEWWARTLLPDGKVLELPLEQAVQHTAVKIRGAELKEMRAALPGVVPGAVIDYGYVLHSLRIPMYERIDLQRKYPIRTLRLRWQPSEVVSGAYRIFGPGLPITSTKDRAAIRVVGNDLPPMVEEPWMPPAYHVRASVTFYYIDPETDMKHYWDDEARKEERYLARFLTAGGDRAIHDVIESWNLSTELGLQQKLQRAYAWVTENVKDTGQLSFEELAASESEDKEAFTAKQVLKAREGTGWQVAALYVGFARALEAEAYLALATDRRNYVWDASLLSMEPFEMVLVAVRDPGKPDDPFVLCEPGTGLEYGEVPWWATGVHAMVSTKNGFKAVLVPPSDARKNLSDTAATFTFDEEGTMHVAWTRTNKNLRGFDERLHLKNMDAHARGERLQELCGKGGSMEVAQAESPGMEEKFGSLRLECALDAEMTGPTEEIGRYSFTFSGPWIEPLPDFEGRATRVHPAVFDFGRVDKAKLTIQAPPGFAPKGAPEPKQIDTPFGRYRRAVRVTEAGYEVDRGVGFTPLMVPPQDYPALRAFLDQIRQADQVALEFERKP